MSKLTELSTSSKIGLSTKLIDIEILETGIKKEEAKPLAQFMTTEIPTSIKLEITTIKKTKESQKASSEQDQAVPLSTPPKTEISMKPSITELVKESFKSMSKLTEPCTSTNIDFPLKPNETESSEVGSKYRPFIAGLFISLHYYDYYMAYFVINSKEIIPT